MSQYYMVPERCDRCGRFVREMGSGVSWGQSYSMTMDGPDLHDARFRCSPCTDKHGMPWSNCIGDQYQGRNP